MAQFGIILNQMGVFALLMVLGIVLRRTGVLGGDADRYLSQLVVKAALPAFIFVNFINGPTVEDLKSMLPVMLFNVLFYFITIFITWVMAKVFRLGKNSRNVFRLCMLIGNIGMIATPIAIELNPKTAMLHLAAVTITDMILMWTYGVALSYDAESPGAEQFRFGPEAIKKMLLTPPLIAIVISLIFLCLGLKLPAFVNTAVEKVGNMLSPLGIIYIGTILTWKDIRYALHKGVVFAGIIVKMIFIPALMFKLMDLAGLPLYMCTTQSIIVGAPTFVVATILVKEHGSDYPLAAGMVMLSTLLYVFTYPLSTLLISLI